MRILITGGSGLVATELTHLILKCTDYDILLLSRDKSNLSARYKAFQNRVECLDLDSFTDNYNKTIDVVVHAAFSRKSSGKEIASSLLYLQRLCDHLATHNPRIFINISSQSIYGSNYTPGIEESATPMPDYLYALGKFSSELLISAWFSKTSTSIYNIRLSSICENARFLRIFIEKTLQREVINLTAPNQVVSFIDVRDVASALLTVIESQDPNGGTYNLGSGKWYTILDVTKRIEVIGINKYGIDKIQLDIKDEGTNNTIGMSCKAFNEYFNWSPRYTLDDMLISLYELLLNIKKRGGEVIPISFKIIYSK